MVVGGEGEEGFVVGFGVEGGEEALAECRGGAVVIGLCLCLREREEEDGTDGEDG